MRFASALNRAAAALDTIRGCFLLELEFDSGFVRANDSGRPYIFNGNTYYGLGTFGTFDGITEDITRIAHPVRLQLAGIDTGLISTIRTERYQGRPARLYCAMLDEADEFVDDPELQWSGYMDVMTLEIEDKTATIVLDCEHRARQAPQVSRFCDAEQKMLYPGDRFFELLPFVAGYTSDWGGKTTRWNYQPGGGYRPA